MRVLVTGGRKYGPAANIRHLLASIHQARFITVLVEGACPTGADQHAFQWAKENNVKFERHPANWEEYGKSAGPIRNTEMAKLGADVCIAFPGGNGTADMVEKAKAAGIQVLDLRK